MVAAGHDVDKVWGYTPRQVNAFLFLLDRRRKREAALDLSIVATGSRGEPRALRQQIKNWEKAEPSR